MRLTRKKAIELCIELWTWLAKTGKTKEEWPEWEQYGAILENCWLCEYFSRITPECACSSCIYKKKYGHCNTVNYKPYVKWHKVKTRKTRKKYAHLFLEQIKELK